MCLVTRPLEEREGGGGREWGGGGGGALCGKRIYEISFSTKDGWKKEHVMTALTLRPQCFEGIIFLLRV